MNQAEGIAPGTRICVCVDDTAEQASKRQLRKESPTTERQGKGLACEEISSTLVKSGVGGQESRTLK